MLDPPFKPDVSAAHVLTSLVLSREGGAPGGLPKELGSFSLRGAAAPATATSGFPTPTAVSVGGIAVGPGVTALCVLFSPRPSTARTFWTSSSSPR